MYFCVLCIIFIYHLFIFLTYLLFIFAHVFTFENFQYFACVFIQFYIHFFISYVLIINLNVFEIFISLYLFACFIYFIIIYLFIKLLLLLFNCRLISSPAPNRQQSDCGREPEVDPGSGLDPHPPLLHLYARLGG